MYKHAKKTRVHGRTNYTGRVKKNVVPFHTQRVSLARRRQGGEGDIVAAVTNHLKSDEVLRDMIPLGA